MKKLLCYFIIAIMSLGLIGCDKQEEEVDAKAYRPVAEFVFRFIDENITEDKAEEYLNMSDEKLNFILTYSDVQGSQLKTDARCLKSMLKAWGSAKEDFGKFKNKGQFEISKTSQGIEAKTEAIFEKRDVTLTLIFDEDGYAKDLNVNGHYSYGEIAEKAGMNTLLGMGTVFVMLIFISFVIYLFNFLPGGERSRARKAKKLEKKKQKEAAVNESDNIDAAGQANDNSELIAVITAAIAASTNKSGDSFVVRSIKRKANK